MDHTITWENSGLSFIRYARRRRLVSRGHLAKSFFTIILYRLSVLNIERWYEKNVEALAGARADELEAFCRIWFRDTLGKAVYREALDLIGARRREGLKVAIISNAPSFFVKPMAEALEVRDVISTEVETRDGALTGSLLKPLCYGEGKKLYALRWAQKNGIDLGKSYFYTDSYFDLPLMEAVGHPCATNPDLKLRRAAWENGWPIMVFRRESAF